jgi:hypothetical protein
MRLAAQQRATSRGALATVRRTAMEFDLRRFVRLDPTVMPRLVEARCGATSRAIREQRSITDGRITVAAGTLRRGEQERAGTLPYRRDHGAVVEATEIDLPADTDAQQDQEYATAPS